MGISMTDAYILSIGNVVDMIMQCWEVRRCRFPFPVLGLKFTDSLTVIYLRIEVARRVCLKDAFKDNFLMQWCTVSFSWLQPTITPPRVLLSDVGTAKYCTQDVALARGPQCIRLPQAASFPYRNE
ncbi:hypothetical protein BD414DRAFT_85807 [Trametes punicea]|nr:hypothetical protein BD414DRAFT_85807 [Trametes punicea]